MQQNNPEEKQLRVEHEWSQQHVMSWLQDGMAYTILLSDNTCITDAVFHFCALLGKHYFTKGASVYPIEKVYSHSLTGHIPPVSESVPLVQTLSETECLIITDNYDEEIKVITTSEINPITFKRRVQCLMLSGLTQEQAEHIASTEPMKLALFYDIGRGAFAVDAEAVSNTPLYNPYTGKEIPNKTTI